MHKIAILLLIVFSACAKTSDPAPQSIVGSWKFTTTAGPTSGNFSIKQDGKSYSTVDGTFYIKGNKYSVALGGDAGSSLYLIDAKTGANIGFDIISAGSDFKTMTAPQFWYLENKTRSQVFQETVVFTRQ